MFPPPAQLDTVQTVFARVVNAIVPPASVSGVDALQAVLCPRALRATAGSARVNGSDATQRRPTRRLIPGCESSNPPVIPAKAGTQPWVPAFAGMTALSRYLSNESELSAPGITDQFRWCRRTDLNRGPTDYRISSDKISNPLISHIIASFMRHAHRLAADYARRRTAFGAPLAQLPLHRETLLDVEAECAGAFMLAFWLVELLGRAECGTADDDDRLALRLLTPLTKLTTGKQAVAVVSEAIEAFGGAGYVEDTGLPTILRDTHVLPIWEGTTNVLALDLLLRTDVESSTEALWRRIQRAVATARTAGLDELAGACSAPMLAALRWLRETSDPTPRQAGARRFAVTLGRTTEFALLLEHAASVPAGPERDALADLARRVRRGGLDVLPPQH